MKDIHYIWYKNNKHGESFIYREKGNRENINDPLGHIRACTFIRVMSFSPGTFGAAESFPVKEVI